MPPPAPLVFHDQACGVADVHVLRSAAPLHLGLHRLLLVLDVFQCVLHQVAHRTVLGWVQRLDVLQNIQHLETGVHLSDQYLQVLQG